MGPVSANVAIDAPRERVFETISDLALRPSFCDHFMTDYRIARLSSSGVGASARFRVSPRGFHTWMETVINETERPHLITEHGRCGRLNRVPTFTAWELLEGPGAVTTVQLTFWTEPTVSLDRLREHLGAHRWYRRRWSTALRRLARALEGDEPLERLEVGGADLIPTTAGSGV
jgi:uncharacterized protein YndB with AHSA1/START domain